MRVAKNKPGASRLHAEEELMHELLESHFYALGMDALAGCAWNMDVPGLGADALVTLVIG